MLGRAFQVVEAGIGHSGEEIHVGVARQHLEHATERLLRLGEAAALERVDPGPIFGGGIEIGRAYARRRRRHASAFVGDRCRAGCEQDDE